ncbi:MAG: RNA-binding protein [Crocinitomicaceae bacterium]|nr:RNA-binding protein [Crocinitomicaceae bacterium]|tara:strand:+ start:18592 stop:18912 length:321 start_codon:yes stop_codon:yes gene_type:complete
MKKSEIYNETKRRASGAPLKDIINRWLKAYRLDNKMKEFDVINAWPEIMGVAVANRTSEIRIKAQTLYLKLDSAVMRDELSHGKQIIIDRINKKAGYKMINDIWFG